jgi:hypothetical protein
MLRCVGCDDLSREVVVGKEPDARDIRGAEAKRQ